MTIERFVPGFRASVAGFHFANRWPPGPAIDIAATVPGPVPVRLALSIGDAANGLCGGMCLAALDLWRAGMSPPPDTTPPAAGSALFRRIVRRQLDSFEGGHAVLRFYLAAVASERRRARIAIRDAWPAVRRQVDARRPAVIGLVHVASADPRRLIANHQVVVHGYRIDAPAGRLELSIWDPNHPDDDGVRLLVHVPGRGGPVTFDYPSGGSPVVGFIALTSEPSAD